MENFILNLANGWTALDLIIMVILLVLWLRSKKQAERKEKLLEFADISKEQLNESILDYRKEIAELKDSNAILRQRLGNKEDYIKRLIDRPRINGKFVKKDTKIPTSYRCHLDIVHPNDGLIFRFNIIYQIEKHSPLTLIGDNSKKYIVSHDNFSKIY